jgi:hypothetical protein
MFIFNIADPITLILMLAITLILIFLGKETKKAYMTALPLFFYLALLIVHVVQMMVLAPEVEDLRRILSSCLAVDFTMILLSFISYLWVDDLESKLGKKKSIDNSLDWFWSKI